jgi:hypothetical protein
MMFVSAPEDDRFALAFQVPRTSGIAVCAAAGAAASATSMTIQASFGMADLLWGTLDRDLGACDSIEQGVRKTRCANRAGATIRQESKMGAA